MVSEVVGEPRKGSLRIELRKAFQKGRHDQLYPMWLRGQVETKQMPVRCGKFMVIGNLNKSDF